MRTLSRRSLLGLLAAAPVAVPAVVAAAQEASLMTVGADIQADGMGLAVMEWPTMPVSTVCAPHSVRAALIEAVSHLPSGLTVLGEADGSVTIRATEAA